MHRVFTIAEFRNIKVRQRVAGGLHAFAIYHFCCSHAAFYHVMPHRLYTYEDNTRYGGKRSEVARTGKSQSAFQAVLTTIEAAATLTVSPYAGHHYRNPILNTDKSALHANLHVEPKQLKRYSGGGGPCG